MDKSLFLSEINLFDELPMQDLQTIDSLSIKERVEKGTVLTSPEHPTDSLFLLKHGNVRVYRVNEQGKQININLLGEGNIFGETSSFSFGDRDDFVESVNDVIYAKLGKAEFEKILWNDPALAMKFISILSSRLNEMYVRSKEKALRDVRYRTTDLLLRISRNFGRQKDDWRTIDIQMTQEDIATIIGSARETVMAAISHLEKDKIIERTAVFYAVHTKKAEAALKTNKKSKSLKFSRQEVPK